MSDAQNSPLVEPDRPRPNRKRKFLSFGVATLLIAVTLSAIVIRVSHLRYERQLVRNWAQEVLNAAKKVAKVDDQVPCPFEASAERQQELVGWHFSAMDRKEKFALIKVITNQFGDSGQKILSSVLEHERDVEVQAILMNTLAFYRNGSDADKLVPYLKSKEDRVRQAAAQSIGIIHRPQLLEKPTNQRFPIRYGGMLYHEHTFHIVPDKTLPNLVIWTSYSDVRASSTSSEVEQVPLSNSIRAKLVEVAIDDPSLKVREAARVTLRNWPFKCKFRFAEWGVWINDEGSPVLAKSLLEEIPPFVHRLNDGVKALESERIKPHMQVYKPIVHITVDEPVVFGVKAAITDGRIWFAYPRPHDYTFTTGLGSKIQKFDPAENLGVNESDRFEINRPWPTWLEPKPEVQRLVGGSMMPWETIGIQSLGVEWKTLMAVPKKPETWKVNEVVDEKYKWWDELRKVRCSWVENLGEAEKYFYYDGPTDKELPFHVTYVDDEISVFHCINGIKETHLSSFSPAELERDRAPKRVKRSWLFVEVDGDSVAGQRFQSDLAPDETKSVDVGMPKLSGAEVFESFVDLAIQEGLTREEAEGMANCWRPVFFESDGKRLLCFFNRKDYDSFCPIEITPEPTEMARCGVVMTELESTELRDDPDAIERIRKLEGIEYKVRDNGLVESITVNLKDVKLDSAKLFKSFGGLAAPNRIEINLYGTKSDSIRLENLAKSNFQELVLSGRNFNSELYPDLVRSLAELKNIESLTLQNSVRNVQRLITSIKQMDSLESVTIHVVSGQRGQSHWNYPSFVIENGKPKYRGETRRKYLENSLREDIKVEFVER